MSEIQVVTAATLNEIPYHELKDKLDELGLGSCWRGGKKKIDIIKDAISKLNVVKQMQEQNLSQEEIDKKLALSDAEKEAQEKKAQEEAQLTQEQTNIQETLQLKQEVTVEEKVDVEVLKKQLARIKGNLKNGPKSHRKQLLTRKAQVANLLREAGVAVED